MLFDGLLRTFVQELNKNGLCGLLLQKLTYIGMVFIFFCSFPNTKEIRFAKVMKKAL